MSATIQALDDGVTRVVKVGPMGPYSNNAYIVRDLGGGGTVLVDMPLDTPDLLAAVEAEGGVHHIVATHWHPDHWMSYDAVRAATSAPVLVGDQEIKVPEERIDGRLADGAEIVLGATRVSVILTPGHTPGSISLRVGRVVISGDTLFDGGPGKTSARGDLEVLIRSIAERLLPLPDDTVVLPGHGANTTIGESRRGYERYIENPHPVGHFGDVEWVRSAAGR